MSARSGLKNRSRIVRVKSKPGVSSVNSDTRVFADWIARDAPGTFLDIGTGTGYVAICLALQGSRVDATDISLAAKVLAEDNARANGVALVVQISDLFERVTGSYDAIGFNPPFSAKPDPYPLAVCKQWVRRIPPLERALMHRMPASVAVYRRELIERFVLDGLRHLTERGAQYLLLYAHEAPHLVGLSQDIRVTAHSPEGLKDRNLVLVKVERVNAEGDARGDRRRC